MRLSPSVHTRLSPLSQPHSNRDGLKATFEGRNPDRRIAAVRGGAAAARQEAMVRSRAIEASLWPSQRATILSEIKAENWRRVRQCKLAFVIAHVAQTITCGGSYS